jgi:hypothetical protein
LLTTNRNDPEHVPNGSFEKFSNDIVEEGAHLGQCAVRWLEALTISSDATYTKTHWAKEFLDVVTSVTIMYEDSVLGRVKALFTADSFSATEPVALPDLEVFSINARTNNSLLNVFSSSSLMSYSIKRMIGRQF